MFKRMLKADRTYIMLDHLAVLDAARYDPINFIRDLNWAVIDEVQRVPELLLAIKNSAMRITAPGGFLLTGIWQAYDVFPYRVAGCLSQSNRRGCSRPSFGSSDRPRPQ